MSKLILLLATLTLGLAMVTDSDELFAQRKDTIKDESLVPSYKLPELLACTDGTQVDSVSEWEAKRRPELLRLFADHVYGNTPERKVEVSFGTSLPSWEILDGKATRREIVLHIGEGDSQVNATMLLTLPKSESPVPCFLGYNFRGNHSTTLDEQVKIPNIHVDPKKKGSAKKKSEPQRRGQAAGRWPYEEIVSKGYGIATIFYGDIDPDFDDEFKNGVHPLFYESDQTQPTQHQWGSIGAWAWGLSKALDCLDSIPQVDGKHVAVIGHSRLGKTSLWAGATDQRFWITISNNSGCGGAALHRRKFGETVKVINTNFPHWFCDQFTEYNDKEAEIPVDQHMLMALIAPRPVYVASATQDLWADPKGEFLSLRHAGPTFRLYGEETLPDQPPKPDSPVIAGARGYHIRTGKHNITSYDWARYIEFANLHLKK